MTATLLLKNSRGWKRSESSLNQKLKLENQSGRVRRTSETPAVNSGTGQGLDIYGFPPPFPRGCQSCAGITRRDCFGQRPRNDNPAKVLAGLTNILTFCDVFLYISESLSKAIFIFDKRDSHITFTIFAKGSAGRDNDVGVLNQIHREINSAFAF